MIIFLFYSFCKGSQRRKAHKTKTKKYKEMIVAAVFTRPKMSVWVTSCTDITLFTGITSCTDITLWHHNVHVSPHVQRSHDIRISHDSMHVKNETIGVAKNATLEFTSGRGLREEVCTTPQTLSTAWYTCIKLFVRVQWFYWIAQTHGYHVTYTHKLDYE